MPAFIDQTGKSVSIINVPKRIISLVPSQTELLFDLGLNNEVVGITKFCIHPDHWFRSKTRVGGTKQVNIEIIHSLKPDLIIANKEENIKKQIDELGKYYPVWVSDVNNLEDAYLMIGQIGIITRKEKAAEDIVTGIRQVFSQLNTKDSKIKTTYLIWQNPYMTVGSDTFIHSMMEYAGFENIFRHKTRYPEVKILEIRKLSCELLLLLSENYPFKQKHIEQMQAQLPGTKIILADGEMFSWYGSRLLKAPGYFKDLWQQIK